MDMENVDVTVQIVNQIFWTILLLDIDISLFTASSTVPIDDENEKINKKKTNQDAIIEEDSVIKEESNQVAITE